MTFSIAARCQRTGQIGVAAATALQSVGKLVCHAIPNVGGCVSHALLNPYLAYDGLRLLQAGLSAQEALDRVIAVDPQAQERQAGIVDNQGRVAGWTGSENPPWAGQRTGRNFTTQGNRLAGPEVLDKVVESLHSTEHLSLAERLVLALEAGESVGGDTKGETSANVMVFSEEEYPLCDIRVDEHHDPIAELRRLYGVYLDVVLPKVQKIPKRDDIPRPDMSDLEGKAT
jgi:uncharacterized Ntn-hydrolase superfamily protein